MENEKRLYTTRDLYLASTLMSLGFDLNGIDYQSEGEHPRPVGYFSFEDNQDLQMAVKEYWAHKLAIEPQQFMVNLRNLKAQVNGAYKSPHSKF